MRALFSVAGLLLVLAIVGVLVKKQLFSAPLVPAAAVGSTPQQQSQQIQQQFRQNLESAMQQARPMPDDK